ncbi:MAG: SDR family NAD(P)-dependent oxidoreductase [Alphaproteobacteria bacterium]|nr:MAG: SDR family NAD(P)-dependent oxidoreductase [Alphaproteobacteria bacterium]
MRLDNKNIIVTGANRGIGAAIVRELLKHKVGKVYATARKIESLPDFGDKRVVPVALDITNAGQVASAAEKAKDVHVLINNAGIATFTSLIEGTTDAIAADMNTNYHGTLGVIRAFVPVLQKNGAGLIANVASVVSLAPVPGIGGYSASKAALHSATQSLRTELAARNIQVSGIYPGPIDTDMAKDFPMEKTSAESTAAAIVKGLIAGDDYIFPDPMSAEVGQLWRRDPVALEKQLAAPLDKAA